MRGREFLEFAEFLAIAFSDQAARRSVVSRSYYAAFLEAREFGVRNLGHDRKRCGVEHREVLHLMTRIDPEIGSVLRFLRQFRNCTDHDLEMAEETERRQYEQAPLMAAQVIALLDLLEAELDAGSTGIHGYVSDQDDGEVS